MTFHKCNLCQLLTSLSLCILLLGSNLALAQKEIEEARNYPPGFLDSKSLEMNNQIIDWRIEQLASLQNTYRHSIEKIAAIVDRSTELSEAYSNELPVEIRFTNEETRSRLVGKLMESILDAKLDLATREKEIEILTSRLEQKTSHDSKRELEIERAKNAVRAAELKVAVSESEFSKVRKLGKEGLRPSGETEMAQYAYELSRLELEQAKSELELLSNMQKVEVANEVAQQRVAIEPIKARIAQAETLLQTFSQSADVITKIRSENRKIELYEKDRHLVAEQLTNISREMQELKLLKRSIKKRVDALEKKKEDEADTENEKK